MYGKLNENNVIQYVHIFLQHWLTTLIPNKYYDKFIILFSLQYNGDTALIP